MNDEFYQDDDEALWGSRLNEADVVRTTPEADPTGLAQHAPGAKLDAGKVDYTYLEDVSLALEAICKLFEFGETKYSRGGWQHVDDGVRRYTKAMLRHYFKEREGTDPDSDTLHIVATAWNAVARLELYLRENNNNETE